MASDNSLDFLYKFNLLASRWLMVNNCVILSSLKISSLQQVELVVVLRKKKNTFIIEINSSSIFFFFYVFYYYYYLLLLPTTTHATLLPSVCCRQGEHTSSYTACTDVE